MLLYLTLVYSRLMFSISYHSDIIMMYTDIFVGNSVTCKCLIKNKMVLFYLNIIMKTIFFLTHVSYSE